MGRKIRRVPPEWQHPRDDNGHYTPLYDNDYETVATKWEQDYDKFMALSPEKRLEEYGRAHYWQYDDPPYSEHYRAEVWTPEQATAYQIYETVTEGTPVSPVFDDLDQLIQWLIDQGYSEHAANEFAQIGWALSMTFTPQTGFRSNIHAFDDVANAAPGASPGSA